jgi:hypothetical protein
MNLNAERVTQTLLELCQPTLLPLKSLSNMERPTRDAKSRALHALDAKEPGSPLPLRDRINLRSVASTSATIPCSSSASGVFGISPPQLGRGRGILAAIGTSRNTPKSSAGRGLLGKGLQSGSKGGEITASGDKSSSHSRHLAIRRQIPSDDSGDDGGDVSGGGDSDSASSSSSSSPSSYSSSTGNDSEQDISSEKGHDGTSWKRLSILQPAVPGRVALQNVFRAKPGLTAYSRGVSTPSEAWRLLIDNGLLRHIRHCTEDFAHHANPGWSLQEEELDKFIGLLYLRGVMNQKNFPMNLLWSESMGSAAFRSTMARNRFRDIKKNIRFDVKSTRSSRLPTDKFCMVSHILKRFVENSQKSYIPEENLTVDEQLFPTKARCPFTQFMPNKPDKYGVKFWILAEVLSKYCLNILPYLGKDEERVGSLGSHVVMNLMTPYFGQGYNVTTDNFFTSCDLAQKLLSKRTSLVGTVKSNRRELPPCGIKLDLHESAFYESGQMHLVRYQAKKQKVIHVLSTVHRGLSRQIDGKRKPESVLFYNENKCGVDLMDSMCRQMSTKAGCRRWPLAVFFNILDIAGINAWIIFRMATGSKISRREFLLQLSLELTKQDAAMEINNAPLQPGQGQRLPIRVNCQVKANCNRNRTATVCTNCKRPVCGQCLGSVCIACSTSCR